jgi:hypothetical protein
VEALATVSREVEWCVGGCGAADGVGGGVDTRAGPRAWRDGHLGGPGKESGI